MPNTVIAAPRPRPGVLEISPYVGGRSHASAGRIFKLSSNESALGPSPHALEAYHAAASRLHLYPDGAAPELKAAIGEIHGIKPARILCGNSSDELLHLIAQAFTSEGDEVLITEHGFLAYPIVSRAAGATPKFVRERNLTADVDAILAAVSPRTKIVFLANPNNPTGTYLPKAEILRLQKGLPPHVLLVLDAAYSEFVRVPDYDAGLDLSLSVPNVVMTRTFSKAYGLAGLRIGWLTGSEAVIDALNRIRGPFNVSIPSQAAGAAAMRDRAHLKRVIEHNTHWLAWLQRRIAASGFKVHPSVGNFLLVEFPPTGPMTAERADHFFMERGLILRGVASYHLPYCLRLTVGTQEANEHVAVAFDELRRVAAR